LQQEMIDMPRTADVNEEMKSFWRVQWEQEYLARISMPVPILSR